MKSLFSLALMLILNLSIPVLADEDIAPNANENGAEFPFLFRRHEQGGYVETAIKNPTPHQFRIYDPNEVYDNNDAQSEQIPNARYLVIRIRRP